jgi:polyribonucleotide nucleotidyltransferase
MFNIHTISREWGGRTLTLETGEIARQADGAVVVTYGETSVLCTVVAAKKPNEKADFFPLTVHYQERSYAAGRIPGGFFKREGKSSEKEVLTSRLIDRPLRPSFAEGFLNEVQVICTLLSHDLENDPDVVALIGASAALSLSGVPFMGPVASARVGRINGEFVLNPTFDDLKNSTLDLVVAGTKQGVLMVESEAKELTEATMLDAVVFGHNHMQMVIEAIEELTEKAGKERWPLPQVSAEDKTLFENIQKFSTEDIGQAYNHREKKIRVAALATAKDKILKHFEEQGHDSGKVLGHIKSLEEHIVRSKMLSEKIRIDGRDSLTVRPIVAKVGPLKRPHGSALFTRGETQALVVATLGTTQDEQIVDGLEGESRERFMLHYNFPPYSVGETGRMAAPGRREIGHGKLAWRALNPLIPPKTQFPYTMRVVSEITESNGSSSMATVCGTSLALMDAGVPLARPIAGIAMGLIKEKDDFLVLTDILGDEDHLGDMDFKVAGTTEGITALQMDLKIPSITPDIMKEALDQALQGRLHILSQMELAITSSRSTVSVHAPRMETVIIPREKIRDLIGPGGKVIRDICETTGAKIDISEEGHVEIAAPTQEALDAAKARVSALTVDAEIGKIYKGPVVKVLEFGALVAFLGEKTGMVHISQLSEQRTEKVTDIVKEGDVVFVKVMGFEDRGKIKLSMRGIDQKTGQEKA